jgi:hypothetical protein
LQGERLKKIWDYDFETELKKVVEELVKEEQ